MKTAILIAGPTAGGKSELALQTCARFGGTVINADSMAVYRDLLILTGRPTAADLARAPHALYGHRDAALPYSVALWLAEVEVELAAARAAGAVPVVVGGTGLFFKALTEGLSEIPAVPEAVRARVRSEAEGVPPAILHARLAALDPMTAERLKPTDPQRIVRALEVFAATGRPLASFQARRSAPIVPLDRAVAVALMTERDALKVRIDARFDAMMERGALEEVERLRARGLDPALPAMRALGVPAAAGGPRRVAVPRGRRVAGEGGNPRLCEAADDVPSPSALRFHAGRVRGGRPSPARRRDAVLIAKRCDVQSEQAGDHRAGSSVEQVGANKTVVVTSRRAGS